MLLLLLVWLVVVGHGVLVVRIGCYLEVRQEFVDEIEVSVQVEIDANLPSLQSGLDSDYF